MCVSVCGRLVLVKVSARTRAGFGKSAGEVVKLPIGPRKTHTHHTHNHYTHTHTHTLTHTWVLDCMVINSTLYVRIMRCDVYK